MDKETLSLLKLIIECKEISLYDLIEKYAQNIKKNPEEAFDLVTKMIYYLVGETLVELKTIDGDDGKEDIISPTDWGKAFVKIRGS